MISRARLEQIALKSARFHHGRPSALEPGEIRDEVYRDLKGAVGPIAAFFLRWLLLKIAEWAVDLILEGDDGRGD